MYTYPQVGRQVGKQVIRQLSKKAGLSTIRRVWQSNRLFINYLTLRDYTTRGSYTQVCTLSFFLECCCVYCITKAIYVSRQGECSVCNGNMMNQLVLQYLLLSILIIHSLCCIHQSCILSQCLFFYFISVIDYTTLVNAGQYQSLNRG